MTAPWRPDDILDELRGECSHASHPDPSRALLDQDEIDAARGLYAMPDEHVHIIWQADCDGGYQLILWPMVLPVARPN